MDPQDMIGKTFLYKLHIKGLKALTVKANSAYLQYKFFGKTYISDKFENLDSNEPFFNYECIHRVKKVSKKFLDYLAIDTLRIEIFIQASLPLIDSPPISTANPSVAFNLGNYELVSQDSQVLVEENAFLKKEILKLRRKNDEYTALMKEVYKSMDATSNTNTLKVKLKRAIELDRTLRGTNNNTHFKG
eukprot:g1842.t1